MKNYSFRQFLLTLGLIVITIGAIFGAMNWFMQESILASAFGLLTVLIVTVPLGCIFIALSKILEHVEKAAASNKRAEERLEAILRKMEQAENVNKSEDK